MVKNKFVVCTGLDVLGKILVIEHQCEPYGSEYFICSINNTNKKLTKKTILELLETRRSHSKISFSGMEIRKLDETSYEVIW
jgi:hypothetical protein